MSKIVGEAQIGLPQMNGPVSVRDQKRVKQVKIKRAGENPRKLIIQHLLPTQSAYAPSLYSSSSFSSSTFSSSPSSEFCSIHPSFPSFLSQLRHPALHCVCAPTLLPPLWGTEQNSPLFRLAITCRPKLLGYLLLHDGLKDKKHTHTHSDIIPHMRELSVIY